jgi:endo-1,4-beta-xylanase
MIAIRVTGLFLAGVALLPLTARAAPPQAPIPLWNKVAPGSEGKTGEEKVDTRDGVRRVSSIHRPSITPHLPARGAGNGAAVILMPGGGHRYLAIDNEGHPVASWLSDQGYAAFVLKYRLAREEGSTYKVAEHALADAQRAIRLVRSRARQWGIDPARVGILGFSAGGELAAYAAHKYDAGKPGDKDPVERESSRPAFQGLMYAGSPPAELPVPRDAPPAFICAASDDKNPTRNSLAMFQKLRDAGIETELHIYAKGGHGFGLKQRPLAVTGWNSRFKDWLVDQGFDRAGGPQAVAAAEAAARADKAARAQAGANTPAGGGAPAAKPAAPGLQPAAVRP